MKLERIHRLLRTVMLLQSGSGQNTSTLASACGVSRRTVFRDLGILREAGVPLLYEEEEQRYHIGGGTLLPPTNFSTDEALALIVLCHELGDRHGLPFYEPARSAALKIEGTLPARLRDYLNKLTGAIEIQLPAANPLERVESTYQQIVEALGARCSVRIRYDSFYDADQIFTRLSPYRLLFSRRSWYVIGRSSVHRSVRTFNVGRILKLERLDTAYQIPLRFSIDRYLGNAWHLIPEPGPDHEVVVRFQPMVARNVAEVLWHKTQRLSVNQDGTLDYRVTVSGLNEISWWILGYGDQAEVLEPAKLRNLIIERSQRLLDTYATHKSSGRVSRRQATARARKRGPSGTRVARKSAKKLRKASTKARRRN